MLGRSFSAVLVALFTVATPGLSQASLVWGGISGGRARLDGDPATSVGALLGVDIPLVPFLNAEVGYQDISAFDTQVISASALMRIPILPELHLLGRLGVAHRSQTSTFQGRPNDLFYGFGASLRLASPFSVRAEYQVVHDAAQGDLKTVLGSLVYHF